MQSYPYVITICSEKGGVGKTTLATNLAIFLKALQEDLPVTVFSFDNHFTVDKMFAIPGQSPSGSVADLLGGTTGCELLHTGQYGVNYIPSCATLGTMKSSFRNPMTLARRLACSNIPGIIIVDTRPQLDILSENALYAADRVLVPVKDMASLENCRNIFALFDDKGLDRKSLALLPCIIDSRIKYDGPFNNQKSLLRAFAINRGYRCLDIFIAKSPKVESLNTNPDGKIYPILTHAKGTEVHGQFHRLAATILAEADATRESRALLFQRWLSAEEHRHQTAFNSRKEGIAPLCPLCGQHPLKAGNTAASFYYELLDDSRYGFIDENCFHALLAASIFRIDTSAEATQQILRSTARESLFTFQLPDDNTPAVVECHRFDLYGNIQFTEMLPFKEFHGGIFTKKSDLLYRLLNQTLKVSNDTNEKSGILIYPADPLQPENLLADAPYRDFRKIKKIVADKLAMTAT